jgi:hypothetical protein
MFLGQDGRGRRSSEPGHRQHVLHERDAVEGLEVQDQPLRAFDLQRMGLIGRAHEPAADRHHGVPDGERVHSLLVRPRHALPEDLPVHGADGFIAGDSVVDGAGIFLGGRGGGRARLRTRGD